MNEVKNIYKEIHGLEELKNAEKKINSPNTAISENINNIAEIHLLPDNLQDTCNNQKPNLLILNRRNSVHFSVSPSVTALGCYMILRISRFWNPMPAQAKIDSFFYQI